MKTLICTATLAAFAACGAYARAETANVIQAMDFGQWYITDNSGQHTVTVNVDGSYNGSPALVMLRAPRQGVYNVTGLPNDVVINSVVVNPNENLNMGGGEQFLLDDFNVDFPAVTTGTGTAVMSVGGTARTSGSGSGYAPGVYSGVLTLDIDVNL